MSVTSRTRFTAQAQRERTSPTQNSGPEHMSAVTGAILVHKRGGFQLSAQALWFCKIVEIHRACRRKRTATQIVNNCW